MGYFSKSESHCHVSSYCVWQYLHSAHMANACPKSTYVTWEMATTGGWGDVPAVAPLPKSQLVKEICPGNVKSL